jgi:hypothetical protein
LGHVQPESRQWLLGAQSYIEQFQAVCRFRPIADFGFIQHGNTEFLESGIHPTVPIYIANDGSADLAVMRCVYQPTNYDTV